MTQTDGIDQKIIHPFFSNIYQNLMLHARNFIDIINNFQSNLNANMHSIYKQLKSQIQIQIANYNIGTFQNNQTQLASQNQLETLIESEISSRTIVLIVSIVIVFACCVSAQCFAALSKKSRLKLNRYFSRKKHEKDQLIQYISQEQFNSLIRQKQQANDNSMNSSILGAQNIFYKPDQEQKDLFDVFMKRQIDQRDSHQVNKGRSILSENKYSNNKSRILSDGNEISQDNLETMEFLRQKANFMNSQINSDEYNIQIQRENSNNLNFLIKNIEQENFKNQQTILKTEPGFERTLESNIQIQDNQDQNLQQKNSKQKVKKYKNDYTNGDSGGSISDGYDKESDSSYIQQDK